MELNREDYLFQLGHKLCFLLLHALELALPIG